MGDERSANAVDRKIGERVKARRLELGVSQERLAELTGVTFQQIQKYEKGINRIAAGRLLDIAHALDTPVVTFFEGLRGARGKASLSAGNFNAALATPGAHDLLRTYAAMTPKLRRRILDLVKAVDEEG